MCIVAVVVFADGIYEPTTKGWMVTEGELKVDGEAIDSEVVKVDAVLLYIGVEDAKMEAA